MKILALDVSVNNVGWATFDSKLKVRKAIHQWEWGTFLLEGNNKVMRYVDLRDRINEEIGDVDHLVTEHPVFFNSARGEIAAHQNYTVDLAAEEGYIAGALGKDHHTWHPVTANMWKGTVTKNITMRKFLRVFGKQNEAISEHAVDAIMMLKWWIEEYGPRAFDLFDEEMPKSKLLYI